MADQAGNENREEAQFDVVIVGAGFSGMYMLHKCRGLGLRAVVLDAASDVGGTWYWNRYPGARCDIHSMDYSYSFDEDLQQEWEWSERYSPQPEILSYVEHVAERFDLRRDIRFDTTVVAASYDEDANLWHLETSTGETWSGTFCVLAVGCLSVPQKPDFDGLDQFKGPWYHTGLWPHEGVDFTGLDVAVVGTGSSAIQSIPQIAKQAKHLTVFQRTPNFAVPAWNRKLGEEEVREIKENYTAYREYARWSESGYNGEEAHESGHDVSENRRISELERRWAEGGFTVLSTFSDVGSDLEVNEMVADFARDKIRQRVDDPEVAELLCPKNHPFGTKRLCVDIDYYETYNLPNVSLVNLRDAPIEAITPDGLKTMEKAYSFDAIVFAIGFDAMTGPLLNIDIKGRGGQSLREKWVDGPQTYLGLGVAGFPNMFTVTGPQSPSVLTNMMSAIEQHVEWISDCLGYMKDQNLDCIEAAEEAERDWVKHNLEVADTTLYPQADSWYVGANMEGKPRVFYPYVGGFGEYRKKCDAIAAEGYRGFELASTGKAG
jgi:cyclohexanone monooxygenase